MLLQKQGSTEQGACGSEGGNWKNGQHAKTSQNLVVRRVGTEQERKGVYCNGRKGMNKSTEPCVS